MRIARLLNQSGPVGSVLSTHMPDGAKKSFFLCGRPKEIFNTLLEGRAIPRWSFEHCSFFVQATPKTGKGGGYKDWELLIENRLGNQKTFPINWDAKTLGDDIPFDDELTKTMRVLRKHKDLQQ